MSHGGPEPQSICDLNQFFSPYDNPLEQSFRSRQVILRLRLRLRLGLGLGLGLRRGGRRRGGACSLELPDLLLEGGLVLGLLLGDAPQQLKLLLRLCEPLLLLPQLGRRLRVRRALQPEVLGQSARVLQPRHLRQQPVQHPFVRLLGIALGERRLVLGGHAQLHPQRRELPPRLPRGGREVPAARLHFGPQHVE